MIHWHWLAGCHPHIFFPVIIIITNMLVSHACVTGSVHYFLLEFLASSSWAIWWEYASDKIPWAHHVYFWHIPTHLHAIYKADEFLSSAASSAPGGNEDSPDPIVFDDASHRRHPFPLPSIACVVVLQCSSWWSSDTSGSIIISTV